MSRQLLLLLTSIFHLNLCFISQGPVFWGKWPPVTENSVYSYPGGINPQFSYPTRPQVSTTQVANYVIGLFSVSTGACLSVNRSFTPRNKWSKFTHRWESFVPSIPTKRSLGYLIRLISPSEWTALWMPREQTLDFVRQIADWPLYIM